MEVIDTALLFCLRNVLFAIHLVANAEVFVLAHVHLAVQHGAWLLTSSVKDVMSMYSKYISMRSKH